MKLLMDTCTFLWLALDSAELSPVAREACRTPGNEIYLSAISIWEIALKRRIGRISGEFAEHLSVRPLPLLVAPTTWSGVKRLLD